MRYLTSPLRFIPSQGFRMRVGAPNARRNPYTPGTAAVNQTTLRCWDGTGIGPGTPSVGALDTVAFPAQQCKGGIRSQVYFPQCWDGVNLDSDDHEVPFSVILETTHF